MQIFKLEVFTGAVKLAIAWVLQVQGSSAGNPTAFTSFLDFPVAGSIIMVPQAHQHSILKNLIATATILGIGSKAHSLPFLFETGPQRLNLQSKFAVMGFHLPVPDRRCLCELPWFTFQEADLFFS